MSNVTSTRKLSVIVARFPHALNAKFGGPPHKAVNSLQTPGIFKQLLTDSCTVETTTPDEKWNAEFWGNELGRDSGMEAMQQFEEYPFPGEDAFSRDAENEWGTGALAADGSSDVCSRGYAFLFSSGVIVCFGYSGVDRDWMHKYVRHFQSPTRGWPAMDGLMLIPLIPAFRLFTKGYITFPNEVKITRSDFGKLNWALTRHKFFAKVSKHELRQWTVSDVQIWLRSVGLDAYCEAFLEHGIDGRVLRHSYASDCESADGAFEAAWIPSLIWRVSDRQRFADELSKLRIAPSDLFSESNDLCLPNADMATLMAISLAIAQSARLQTLQLAASCYQKQITGLNEVYLSKQGKVRMMTARHWSRLVHHVEVLKDLLYDSDLEPRLDQVPDFIWERGDVEPLYEATLDYLDYDDTLQSCRNQITSLYERYSSEWAASRDRFGHRLEWIIIFFLFVESKDIWLPPTRNFLKNNTLWKAHSEKRRLKNAKANESGIGKQSPKQMQ